jgi:hypothetical protein
MAKKRTEEVVDVEESDVDKDIEDVEDIEDIVDDDEAIDELVDDPTVDDELSDDEFDEDDDDDGDDDDDHDDETVEALEELETQELALVDDEANETMLVDEVKELRAMRREELTMNVDAQVQKSDEFVCQSCFMVKRTSQLANKRKMICQDCVA